MISCCHHKNNTSQLLSPIADACTTNRNIFVSVVIRISLGGNHQAIQSIYSHLYISQSKIGRASNTFNK